MFVNFPGFGIDGFAFIRDVLGKKTDGETKDGKPGKFLGNILWFLASSGLLCCSLLYLTWKKELFLPLAFNP